MDMVTRLVLAVSVVAFAIPAESPSRDSCDLTVHEWGTFTSVAGADGSAIDWDALGCKDDLPTFVNDFGYRGFKGTLTGTVRMETPVIYFYSQEEVDARVRVAFPHGLITEWYPRANLTGMDTTLKTLTGAIEWNNIRIQPHTTPALPLESAASRYYAARETDAAPITVSGEHEKFLFYRGVGRFPVALFARVAANGAVTAETRGHDQVPFVMYFENRGGRLGYRNAVALDGAVTLDPPALVGDFQHLRRDLQQALIEQGLFPKEALAMVETWKDSWFEEGARLIYIVPSRAIDEVLPLQIEPQPLQTTRVFVGRIELLTPEVIGTVERAIVAKDSVTINRYRRFLEPILKQIAARGPDGTVEVQQFYKTMSGRCE
jgi:hypothetical protein